MFMHNSQKNNTIENALHLETLYFMIVANLFCQENFHYSGA